MTAGIATPAPVGAERGRFGFGWKLVPVAVAGATFAVAAATAGSPSLSSDEAIAELRRFDAERPDGVTYDLATWTEHLVERIAGAVVEAHDARRPARLAVGSTDSMRPGMSAMATDSPCRL